MVCLLCRFKAKPKMDVHKRENLEIAFRFMQDVEKIPMVNIGKYGVIIMCIVAVNLLMIVSMGY